MSLNKNAPAGQGVGREGEAAEADNLKANCATLGSIPSWRDCMHISLTIKAHHAHMKHAAESALLAMLVAFFKRRPI